MTNAFLQFVSLSYLYFYSVIVYNSHQFINSIKQKRRKKPENELLQSKSKIIHY